MKYSSHKIPPLREERKNYMKRGFDSLHPFEKLNQTTKDHKNPSLFLPSISLKPYTVLRIEIPSI